MSKIIVRTFASSIVLLSFRLFPLCTLEKKGNVLSFGKDLGHMEEKLCNLNNIVCFVGGQPKETESQ